MSAPIPVVPVRTPGTNSRAGDPVAFQNVATDLDTNFNAINTWATQVRGRLDITAAADTSYLTPATGWAVYTTQAVNIWRRMGRLVLLTYVLSYTGVIASDANGDISPDKLVATFAGISPLNAVYHQVRIYTGANVNAGMLLNTDGTLYLTGYSCASLSITNPGVSASVSYYTP